MDTIIKNLKHVQNRINRACEIANRDPKGVKLLLATKTVSPERIKIALNAGYTLIAENKIQELKEKYQDLADSPHINHFIGHLQTNKIKEIIRYGVQCVESLDRYDLAEKLHNKLSQAQREIDVFIQVNTSGEESKFGVSPDNALQLVEQVAQFPTLHIKGLMTIGLFSAEEEKVRSCFQLLKHIQRDIFDLNLPNVAPNELSMGMSGDLEVAIEEGATIVRVGTAIFGQRVYPDSYYWNENQPK